MSQQHPMTATQLNAVLGQMRVKLRDIWTEDRQLAGDLGEIEKAIRNAQSTINTHDPETVIASQKGT